MKKFNRVYTVLFILFIGVFLALFIILPDKSFSSAEKRNLQQFPEISLTSITSGTFMDEIGSYAADQFPFRDSFMKMRTTLSKFIGNRESQGVYACGDTQLMERFLNSDTENEQETIEQIDSFIARYPDTSFYMLLSPNAISVYPERLPENALTDDQNTYIDDFYDALSEKSNFTAVDVRQAFADAKDQTELFYLTDHHWTTDGAEIAFRTLADKLELENVPEFESHVVTNSFYGSLVSKSGFSVQAPDAIKIYEPVYESDEEAVAYTVTYEKESIRKATLYEADALESDNAYEVFFGSNHPIVTINTMSGSGRKLLVIKDSYANSLVPFLIPEYNTITMVDPRYYYDDIDALMTSGGYTEVLFLYNVNTLSEDNVLKTVLTNNQ